MKPFKFTPSKRAKKLGVHFIDFVGVKSLKEARKAEKDFLDDWEDIKKRIREKRKRQK